MRNLTPAARVGLSLAVAVVVALAIGWLGTWLDAANGRTGGGGVMFAFVAPAFFVTWYVLGLEAWRRADDGERAAALSLRPAPGNALVIVYRHGLVGYAQAIDGGIGGQFVAQLAMGRYSAVEVPAGRHTVTANLHGANGPGTALSVELDLADGQSAALRAGLGLLRRDDDPAAAARKLSGRTMVAPAVRFARARDARG